jgi:protein-export membrane protein SecD
MTKIRIYAVLLLIVGSLLGAFVHYSEQGSKGFLSKFPFKLGLDLNGGTHLVYQANVKDIPAQEVSDAMNTLKNVIEARINAFGVAEPIIQTEKSSSNGQELQKFIVELPGVTDINKAVELIGKTPVLEFKTEKISAPSKNASSSDAVAIEYETTQLTGRYLKSAQVEFDQNTNQPIVSITFNDEGKKLFAEMTSANIGKTIAIFLDGHPISTPVVQTAITDGKAIITGRFTPVQARSLARDLKFGALPVPIELVGTQTIGASLGSNALASSVKAGEWGFIIVALFLVLWYRLPGLLAVVSLAIYVVIMLVSFKVFGVVLTSAGLAGFIISIGMAVDGNILIFERMREEFAKGYSLEDGIKEGFARAWLSIRDSNISSIITACILFFTATSPLIKGFSLVFGLGVLASMFTSIVVSRTFLLALGVKRHEGFIKFLFGNGIRN